MTERLYLCAECGRTSPERVAAHPRAEAGWDQACANKSTLVWASSIQRNAIGRVVKASPVHAPQYRPHNE